MIKNIFIILGLLLTGCSAKYQVVQELDVNMYHMHSPKKRDVVIIFTADKLELNGWYKLKQINIIQPEGSIYEK